MDINIAGLIKNSRPMLKKHGPLLPLYEAIINSIHSINEKAEKNPSFNGEISIHLERHPQLDGVKNFPDLKNIIIRDNGIGFHEKNYNSFNTSYSLYKEFIGGKGLGRFSYLVAFL